MHRHKEAHIYISGKLQHKHKVMISIPVVTGIDLQLYLCSLYWEKKPPKSYDNDYLCTFRLLLTSLNKSE